MLSKPIEHRTTHSFEQALNIVLSEIAKAGLTVVHQMDHAKAAGERGLSMPQTRVIFYGNPKVGTPLMLDIPLTALDLPLRMLVRELPGKTSAIAFRQVAEDFEALGMKSHAAAGFDKIQQSIADAACGSCPTRTYDDGRTFFT